MNRRIFLKSSGLAMIAGGFLPGAFVRMAEASSATSGKVLITIFLRGAVDGLNVVAPYGEKTYYASRPTIAIPRPGKDGGAIDLDGFFGIHPSLEALDSLFRDRSLAFVHAVGSPDSTRSHFDAQDFMESGTPGVKSTRDGFLSRAIGKPLEEAAPLRAVSLTPNLPRILSGSANAISMRSISEFGVKAGRAAEPIARSFEEMYGETVASTGFSTSANGSFEAIRILKESDPTRIRPAGGAKYPRGEFGESMQQIAQLIKAGVGLEVAFTDVGGWDTHAAQGASTGQLARLLKNYSDAVAAFVTDLGAKMDDIVLVTMSEFGRTVKENGNRGTDHGHGNMMIVAGGGVKGGKVYGKWPGLDERHLYEGRDLEVTTDFRDVMSEVLTKHCSLRDMSQVFPGFTPRNVGLLA